MTAPDARPAMQGTAASPATELQPAAPHVYAGVIGPYCPELLPANCQSPPADSLRRAVAGASRAPLVADLVATYGERIRAAPALRGAGLVAWVASAVVLVGGAARVAR